MTCTLCHQDIGPHEPSVATRSGGRVHIGCADAKAQAAQRSRDWWASISAGLLFDLVLWLLVMGYPNPAVFALLAGLLIHARLHAIFWRHHVQRLKLHCRGVGRGWRL